LELTNWPEDPEDVPKLLKAEEVCLLELRPLEEESKLEKELAKALLLVDEEDPTADWTAAATWG